jgi:hypothetical protein
VFNSCGSGSGSKVPERYPSEADIKENPLLAYYPTDDDIKSGALYYKMQIVAKLMADKIKDERFKNENDNYIKNSSKNLDDQINTWYQFNIYRHNDVDKDATKYWKDVIKEFSMVSYSSLDNMAENHINTSKKSYSRLFGRYYSYLPPLEDIFYSEHFKLLPEECKGTYRITYVNFCPDAFPYILAVIKEKSLKGEWETYYSALDYNKYKSKVFDEYFIK